MALVSDTKASVIPEHATAQAPVRVCMHVLSPVPGDVRIIREATALIEAGFSVRIVDIGTEKSLPGEEVIDGILIEHIISTRWYVSTRFKLWFLVKFLVMIIIGTVRLLRSSADVYHAQDQKTLPACYLAARIRRKPLIYDAHELPLSDIAVRRWPRLHAIATRFLGRMLSKCARVITVSGPIAQDMRQSYSISNVSLIRNVPEYVAASKSDLLRQRLELSQKTRIALYQGNLHPNRNLDALIRAARFLGPDIVIVIMGGGNDAMLAQLEGLIESEGVAERVKLLPPVRYEELLAWTTSADVGLIIYAPEYSSNVRMCLPNKFFEYLMAGLPVMISELEAMTEIINQYNVGRVVTSLAPDDVAAAITGLLEDDAALVDMQRRALDIAQNEFCWEKEKVHLVDIYQSILRDRHAASV